LYSFEINTLLKGFRKGAFYLILMVERYIIDLKRISFIKIRKMKAKTDRKIIIWSPIIAGGLMGLIWFLVNRDAVIEIEDYRLMATLSATLLGFFVVAKSVILAITDGYYYKLIRESEHFESAMRSFQTSMIYTLIELIYCIVIIFCRSIGAFQSFLLIVITTIFLVAVIINIRIYGVLTRIAAKEKQEK